MPRCKGYTCEVQRFAMTGLDCTLRQHKSVIIGKEVWWLVQSAQDNPRSVIIGKELWWLVQSANDYRLVLFRPTRLAALLVLGPSLLVQRKWSNLNLVRLPVWFTSSSDWNWNYESNWNTSKIPCSVFNPQVVGIYPGGESGPISLESLVWREHVLLIPSFKQSTNQGSAFAPGRCCFSPRNSRTFDANGI